LKIEAVFRRIESISFVVENENAGKQTHRD